MKSTTWTRYRYAGPGGGLYTDTGGGAYTGTGGGLSTGPGGGLSTGPGGGLYTGSGTNPYRSSHPPLKILLDYLDRTGKSAQADRLRKAHGLPLEERFS
jgi:hypothetical protein